LEVVSRRWLALALLIYVTLDFANPLMPGAVQFDEGSVDVVQADRARPASAGVTVDLSPAPEPLVDFVQIQTAARRLRSLRPWRRHQIATGIWRVPVRASSDVSPSSEDH
jgi:hypothetical protein